MDITRVWPRVDFYYKQIHAKNQNMQKLLCVFGANQSYRSTMLETTRSVKRKKNEAANKSKRKEYARIKPRTASKEPPQKKERKG